METTSVPSPFFYKYVMPIPGFLVRGKVRRDHGGEGVRASDIGGYGARAPVLGGDGGGVPAGVPVDLFHSRAKVPSPPCRKRKRNQTSPRVILAALWPRAGLGGRRPFAFLVSGIRDSGRCTFRHICP